MANELKHGSVGTELTQAEWEAVGTHVVANQAVGDIIYADTTSQLLRLGVGSTNDVLRVTSGKPDWQATSFITSLGTIATGVWQGTDVGVSYGGTGVSTLTANGVLVGNGASAIGSIDMSTKGHVLIGDGSGNPQMLGVGTNTHVLTANSSAGTGVNWAAPAAAAAGSLTGSTLASGVTASSLTSVGTLTALTVDNVAINGTTIGHTSDTDLITLADSAMTVAGKAFVNETANANMTLGLTLNQGAADDWVLVLKSSDVATGLTSAGSTFFGTNVETDDYGGIRKSGASSGGISIGGMLEDGAGSASIDIRGCGGTANTTKSTGGFGLCDILLAEHDGANALADITANGNVFSIRARVGGANATRLIVDEDGDLYSVTASQTFDEFDDALMVRALDQTRGDIIRDRWDDYVGYNERALIDAGVLGAPIAEGGMTNVTQLQRLHNGAIWQGYTRQMEMQERIDSLETKLLALEGA